MIAAGPSCVAGVASASSHSCSWFLGMNRDQVTLGSAAAAQDTDVHPRG